MKKSVWKICLSEKQKMTDIEEYMLIFSWIITIILLKFSIIHILTGNLITGCINIFIKRVIRVQQAVTCVNCTNVLKF